MLKIRTSISEEKTDQVIEILKQYLEENKLEWEMVFLEPLKDAIEHKNFKRVMSELRYDTFYNKDEKLYYLDFTGDFFYNEPEIFEVLSPCMNDGYIQWDDRMRMVFKDGNMTIKYGKTIWE